MGVYVTVLATEGEIPLLKGGYMKTNQQLLDIFEHWAEVTIDACLPEYGAWEDFFEDYNLDEEEWTELRKLGLSDLYDNFKNKIAEGE